MPKVKPRKGMLKRIKITKSGRIKMARAGGRHKRSHKNGSLLRSYRKNNYADASDTKRIASMLFIPAVSGAKAKKKTSQAEASD